MEGTSTSYPEGTVPEEVQFIFDWKPPKKMKPGQEADPDYQPRAPTGERKTTIGYTRPAAFYDKHLAPHLVLQHVIHLDTLVSAMESAVDQAIQDARDKHFLPKNGGGVLPSMLQINANDESSDWAPLRELGVAEHYSRHAARYCCPLASTLAIHPSSEDWYTALIWTTDVKEGRWTIADGALR